MIKINRFGGDGYREFLPKLLEHTTEIKHLKEAVGEMFEDDVEPHAQNKTVAYISTHIHQAAELSEALAQDIYDTPLSVMEQLSPKGRNALAAKIDTLFETVSALDFDQIHLVDQASYATGHKLLQMLAAYQALFPKQVDDHLKHAENALIFKIKRYEQKAGAYVLSEPPEIMKTLSALEVYVDAEIKKIIAQPDWQMRLNAYQALEVFTKDALEKNIEFLDEAEEKQVAVATAAAAALAAAATQERMFTWDMLWVNIVDRLTNILVSDLPKQTEAIFNDPTVQKKFYDERSEVLLDRIHKAGVKAKEYGLMPILKAFNQLTDEFQQQVWACPEIKHNLDVETEVKLLLENLDNAREELRETGDVLQFKKTVDDLFEQFPKRAKFEMNGKKPWFKAYIIEPFKQFKSGVKELLELMRDVTAGKDVNLIEAFKQKKSKHTDLLDDYHKHVNDLFENKPKQP